MENEARLADDIDRAYELVEPTVEEVVSDIEATISARLINPFFEFMDIKLIVDGVLLGERTGLSKGIEGNLMEEPTTSGTRTLKVEFQTETAEISFEGCVNIKPGNNDLLIQFWDRGYPPKLVLNRVVINRSVGPRYREVGKLPDEPVQVQRYGLNVRDADEILFERFEYTEKGLIPKFNLFEIWIDEEKVDSPNPDIGDIAGPLRHQAELSPRKYRVKVGSPALHTMIFDGEIVFNGIIVNELTVHACKTLSDPCRITLAKAHETIFEGSYKDLEYTERFMPKEKTASRLS